MPDDNSVRHFPARRWRVLVLTAVGATLLFIAAAVIPLWVPLFYSKVAHQAYVDWSLVDVCWLYCHCRTGDRASRRLRDMPGSRVVYSRGPCAFRGRIRWVLLALSAYWVWL